MKDRNENKLLLFQKAINGICVRFVFCCDGHAAKLDNEQLISVSRWISPYPRLPVYCYLFRSNLSFGTFLLQLRSSRVR